MTMCFRALGLSTSAVDDVYFVSLLAYLVCEAAEKKFGERLVSIAH